MFWPPDFGNNLLTLESEQQRCIESHCGTLRSNEVATTYNLDGLRVFWSKLPRYLGKRVNVKPEIKWKKSYVTKWPEIFSTM